MAALIPGARFVPLESRNHVLFHTEPAWQQFVDEVISFPVDTAADSRALETPLVSSLTAREKAVLELVAQGRRNSEIARTLSLSEKTVRNYLSVICDKLQVSGRSQAIVLAREAGFGFQPRRPER